MTSRTPHEPPAPDDLLDEEEPLRGRESRAGLVPEFVRKMAVAGLGALFMTEEGLRSLASQLKLPKEALAFVLSQAEKTKDDITRVMSEEIRRFLQSETLRDEFLKLFAGMTIEVKAQIRLLPKEDKEKDKGGVGVDVTELHARGSGSKRSRQE
jgi:hypothetical protein